MNKKLKIALVTNNWEPYAGGLVSSLRIHCAALQKMGHKVMLVTLDFNTHKRNDPYFVKRIYCPIRWVHKDNILAVPWRTDKQMNELMMLFKPDIIHVHHPFLLGSSALRIARKHTIPIIFTYHSIYTAFAHYIPLPRKMTQFFIHMLVKNFCKKVDGIIAPSKRVQNLLQTHAITTPTTVIFSAIQSIFSEQSALLLSERTYVRIKKPLQLLCVSRFVPEKNIFFLLDMFVRLSYSNFTLTLVGYGYEYTSLTKYAYEILKCDPAYVIFIYKPSLAELAHAYRTADLFVFSGPYETQGIVFAEAMASGLPVVSVDGPGQQDIIQHGVNGFIIKDQNDMINIIEMIAADHDLYSFLSHNAYQTACAYTPEHMGDELIHFYRKFISI